MKKADYDEATKEMTPVQRSFYDILLRINEKFELLLKYDEETRP